MIRQRRAYRGWHVTYDPPPVPWRAFDYAAVRDSDDLNCHAETLAGLRAEIDRIEAEDAA